MNIFYAYVLQSETSKKYYIGSTQDIDARIKKHNIGAVRSTKNRGPFRLIYREIKRYKGGRAFKKLIQTKHSGIV